MVELCSLPELHDMSLKLAHLARHAISLELILAFCDRCKKLEKAASPKPARLSEQMGELPKLEPEPPQLLRARASACFSSRSGKLHGDRPWQCWRQAVQQPRTAASGFLANFVVILEDVQVMKMCNSWRKTIRMATCFLCTRGHVKVC